MDVKIENGDIAVNTNKEPIYISAVEEIAQRVKIACSVKKGDFCYDKNMGCYPYDIDFSEDDAKEKLSMVFKQAIVDIGYTDLAVESIKQEEGYYLAKVRVECGKKHALTEVVIYD